MKFLRYFYTLAILTSHLIASETDELLQPGTYKTCLNKSIDLVFEEDVDRQNARSSEDAKDINYEIIARCHLFLGVCDQVYATIQNCNQESGRTRIRHIVTQFILPHLPAFQRHAYSNIGELLRSRKKGIVDVKCDLLLELSRSKDIAEEKLTKKIAFLAERGSATKTHSIISYLAQWRNHEFYTENPIIHSTRINILHGGRLFYLLNFLLGSTKGYQSADKESLGIQVTPTLQSFDEVQKDYAYQRTINYSQIMGSNVDFSAVLQGHIEVQYLDRNNDDHINEAFLRSSHLSYLTIDEIKLIPNRSEPFDSDTKCYLITYLEKIKGSQNPDSPLTNVALDKLISKIIDL